jgi:hypothetical protein
MQFPINEVLRATPSSGEIQRQQFIFGCIVNIDPTLRPQHLNRCAHVFSLARSELRA